MGVLTCIFPEQVTCDVWNVVDERAGGGSFGELRCWRGKRADDSIAGQKEDEKRRRGEEEAGVGEEEECHI